MVKIRNKERIIKSARKKTTSYIQEKSHHQIFQQKFTNQKGMVWYSQSAEGKNFQPRIFYPARLSFIIEGEIMNFPNKQKLMEFINNKPALGEMFKGLLI